jgi:hypothetical protein
MERRSDDRNVPRQRNVSVLARRKLLQSRLEKPPTYSEGHVTLVEPLSRYTNTELLAWLDQENIPITNISRRQLLKTIENSSIIGGNGRIFKKNPDEPVPTLSVLPREITQEFLHHLPIESLIEFCKTSPEFSQYCKDSGFWRLKANYIHGKTQIMKILEDSVKYGVASLANIMLEKLHAEKSLTPKELESIFIIVIQSGKLSVIKKMIEIFDTELSEFLGLWRDKTIMDSADVFAEKLREFSGPEGPTESTKTEEIKESDICSIMPCRRFRNLIKYLVVSWHFL